VTLLIIGVLLAVAILAILGAVFLSISEQRAEKARSNGGANLSSAGFNTMIAQQQTENRQVEQTTAPGKSCHHQWRNLYSLRI